MEYRRYAAPTELKNYIRYYWSLDLLKANIDKFQVRNFADRYPRLVFQHLDRFEPICDPLGKKLPQCYLSGIDTKKNETIFGRSFSHFGVSFKPQALNALFNVNAHHLVNEVPDIQLFCDADVVLQLNQSMSHRNSVQLLNKYFYDKLFAQKNAHPIINHIIDENEINISSQVSLLPEKYNVSAGHLERLFKCTIGVSPKKFQRIIRFRKALQLLNHAKYSQLTSVCYQLNYNDQSHFIKDFKAFSGMTPYEFVKGKYLGTDGRFFTILNDSKPGNLNLI